MTPGPIGWNGKTSHMMRTVVATDVSEADVVICTKGNGTRRTNYEPENLRSSNGPLPVYVPPGFWDVCAPSQMETLGNGGNTMTKNNYTNIRQKVQRVLEEEGLSIEEAARYADDLVDGMILNEKNDYPVPADVFNRLFKSDFLFNRQGRNQ